MASVRAYLKKLLYQYDCVVVPELGAFLTHYQPASFSESSGLYLPPRKRVAFNEALRLDDGILANYIMLHEPVSREEAQRYIGAFVNELRQELEQTGRFELDGIGAFSRNDEGRLQFEPSLRHNFFGEAYGMSAIPAAALDRQSTPEPVLEAVPATTVGPVRVPDDEPLFEPVRRSRSVWRVAAAVLLVGALGLISYYSVFNPGQPLQSSLDPASLLHVPAAFFARPANPEKSSGPVVRKVKPAVAAPSEVGPVAAVKESATAAPVPTPVIVSKPAIAPVSVAKPVRTGPYFTVIAGSFASKRNALRLRHQLHRAGYTDAFILFPNQRGQLYKVAAAGSSDRQEAISRMAAISELAKTESWLYEN